MERHAVLVSVKLLHTAVWLFFAGCIVAIPVVGARRHFGWALALTATVLVECIILAANRGRCPLTGVAARYTEQRADNFDIYLPVWLARWNKRIFGVGFVAGLIFVFARWFAS